MLSFARSFFSRHQQEVLLYLNFPPYVNSTNHKHIHADLRAVSSLMYSRIFWLLIVIMLTGVFWFSFYIVKARCHTTMVAGHVKLLPEETLWWKEITSSLKPHLDWTSTVFLLLVLSKIFSWFYTGAVLRPVSLCCDFQHEIISLCTLAVHGHHFCSVSL